MFHETLQIIFYGEHNKYMSRNDATQYCFGQQELSITRCHVVHVYVDYTCRTHPLRTKVFLPEIFASIS